MRRTLVDRLGIRKENLQVVQEYSPTHLYTPEGTEIIPAGFFPKFRYRGEGAIIPDPGNSAGKTLA